MISIPLRVVIPTFFCQISKIFIYRVLAQPLLELVAKHMVWTPRVSDKEL